MESIMIDKEGTNGTHSLQTIVAEPVTQGAAAITSTVITVAATITSTTHTGPVTSSRSILVNKIVEGVPTIKDIFHIIDKIVIKIAETLVGTHHSAVKETIMVGNRTAVILPVTEGPMLNFNITHKT